jgi:hypothetical protein
VGVASASAMLAAARQTRWPCSLLRALGLPRACVSAHTAAAAQLRDSAQAGCAPRRSAAQPPRAHALR